MRMDGFGHAHVVHVHMLAGGDVGGGHAYALAVFEHRFTPADGQQGQLVAGSDGFGHGHGAAIYQHGAARRQILACHGDVVGRRQLDGLGHRGFFGLHRRGYGWGKSSQKGEASAAFRPGWASCGARSAANATMGPRRRCFFCAWFCAMSAMRWSRKGLEKRSRTSTR
ncbi:hypothetical protein D3C85_1358170 [compost metagenome]